MYAIQNIKNGKWVYGTNYRYSPPHQKTSFDRMLTYNSLDSAKLEFYCKRCNNDYRIVELEEVRVRMIIPLSKEDITEWINRWRNGRLQKRVISASTTIAQSAH